MMDAKFIDENGTKLENKIFLGDLKYEMIKALNKENISQEIFSYALALTIS